jgi:hypothetical protein
LNFLTQDFRKNFIDKLSGQRIIRRRIFRSSPAKNHPSEELSGEELSGEEFSALTKKISVALWRRIFLAKNHPMENFSPPGIFFERRIIRRRILIAKNSPAKNHPSEKLSGEEFS